MSSHTDSRITRTSGSTGRSTTRTRYATGGATTVVVVQGIKFWRRLRQTITRATRAVTETVTAGGWMLVAAAVVGLTAGLILGWIEFVAAGTIALSLLLLASVFLFGARAYEVDLTLAHDRVVAGAEVSGAITVTNIGRRLALPGVVDVPVGEGLVEIAVPLLRPGAVFSEQVAIPTHRRGVIAIGPARTVRGDPLGLLRRETAWQDHHTLYVHPVTTVIPSTATGFVRDLEGNPSSLIVDSDISFHAIREYVPGDSRRQVHWKSTAKTGTLMVRQYEESRRSRMLIALATAETEFANEDEFELAVSAVGSLGVRGIRDGRDVDVVVGQEIPEFARRITRAVHELPTVSARTLLDALCEVAERASVNPLLDVATFAVEAHRDVSVGFLVCGSTVTAHTIQSAAVAFPLNVSVIVIVCDPTAEPGYRQLGAIAVITIGLLDDLRHILARRSAA